MTQRNDALQDEMNKLQREIGRLEVELEFWREGRLRKEWGAIIQTWEYLRLEYFNTAHYDARHQPWDEERLCQYTSTPHKTASALAETVDGVSANLAELEGWELVATTQRGATVSHTLWFKRP